MQDSHPTTDTTSHIPVSTASTQKKKKHRKFKDNGLHHTHTSPNHSSHDIKSVIQMKVKQRLAQRHQQQEIMKSNVMHGIPLGMVYYPGMPGMTGAVPQMTAATMPQIPLPGVAMPATMTAMPSLMPNMMPIYYTNVSPLHQQPMTQQSVPQTVQQQHQQQPMQQQQRTVQQPHPFIMLPPASPTSFTFPLSPLTSAFPFTLPTTGSSMNSPMEQYNPKNHDFEQ